MAARSVERFDPEGRNSPRGEWRRKEQPARQAVEAATGLRLRSGRNRGEPKPVAERKGRTGSGNGEPGKRSSRPGTLTPEWSPRKGEPLRARERPLRAPNPVEERSCGGPGSCNPGGGENATWGAERPERTALRDAMLNTVHAGGGQGCESGHLEPFLFLRH